MHGESTPAQTSHRRVRVSECVIRAYVCSCAFEINELKFAILTGSKVITTHT